MIFEKLVAYLNNLMTELSDAYLSFALFEGLRENKAPNLIGDARAKENARVMNVYKHFFITAEKTAFAHSILTLAKFFDEMNQSLSIYTILNFLKSNRKHILVNDFKEFYKERNNIEELSKKYVGVTNNLILDIENKISVKKTTIEKVMFIRDKHIAHNDKKKGELAYGITVKEILDLFMTVESILQMLCGSIMEEEWSFESIKEACKEDIDGVLSHIKKSMYPFTKIDSF